MRKNQNNSTSKTISIIQRKDKEILFSQKLLVFVACFLFSFTAKSEPDEAVLTIPQIQLFMQNQSDEMIVLNDSVVVKKVKFKRGKAIILTIFTGFLGGHRIYFGTHQRTPIIYSLTFGGVGILPLIDLIHIIFTKDLSEYDQKSQVIMWGK